MFNELVKEEVIICGLCRGEGDIQDKVCENYHKHVYRNQNRECATCDGTGKLRKTTKTIIRAFKVDLMV